MSGTLNKITLITFSQILRHLGKRGKLREAVDSIRSSHPIANWKKALHFSSAWLLARLAAHCRGKL